LELLVSDGQDPFTRLQVGLNRQIFSIDPAQGEKVYPSALGDRLQTQRVYIFSRHNRND
jgi:3,4-dihydroxy 2-butanone 4-phosphate synthase/GTP cyclohydrolase II